MNPDLDLLIDVAGDFARHALLRAGHQQLVPSWLIVLPNGEITIVGTPWRNDREKVHVLKKMRQHLRKLGAVCYSFVGEVWFAVAPKGTDLNRLDEVTPPSARLDRQEAVMAVAADFLTSKGKIWLLVRDTEGKIIELTEEGPAHAHMVSQFLGLLQSGN